MKHMKLFALATVVISILSSCNETTRESLLPKVSGKEGEVLIVINKGDWEGNIGNIIRDSLSQEYPYLPQSEPIFDASYVQHSAFNHLYQSHRNIIIVNIDPKVTEPGIVYKKDVWAIPQCVIRINATSSNAAAEIFKENCNVIIPFIEQMERDRSISNTLKYEERSVTLDVRKKFGGSPRFPFGYRIKKSTEDFMWVSHDTQYTLQNVLIYKYPKENGMDMMAPENIKAATDTMLMENIPGMVENSYMIISPVIDPYVGYRKYKDNHFAEMKGFWEVHGDYMGGPFISHTYYAPDGENMLTILGFAYAPKYDKRTYIRQLDAILCSFEWNKK